MFRAGCIGASTVAVAVSPGVTGTPAATILEASVPLALEHTPRVVLPELEETAPDEKLLAVSTPKPESTLHQEPAVAPLVAT